jgi:hypothetical protein
MTLCVPPERSRCTVVIGARHSGYRFFRRRWRWREAWDLKVNL